MSKLMTHEQRFIEQLSTLSEQVLSRSNVKEVLKNFRLTLLLLTLMIKVLFVMLVVVIAGRVGSGLT